MPDFRVLLTAGAAGAVAANVVPHLAHGLTGTPFPTPFADPPGVGDSSPGLNVVWASMNAAAAVGLLYAGRARLTDPAFVGVGGASAVVSAMALRRYFARVRPTHNEGGQD
ncbi:hypothetical protein GIY30_22545 [Gordonia sp. HNM0687]|uniref:Uncharacterized protein n=1 Tax=Gordonia mangrovi TaxID=2665643 RepID=A0A6L7GX38_9ACTN|nr:hypothetical protein [Gordonia mangrovi]MXP24122.1 hypothetical protein [Gordonia mangrovi]UVF78076.1 hypothetical protein NWF22_23110 [Gordonia mangrovi]